MVCEIGLSELLIRHAPTLQHLDLFNLALWSGSFEGLFSSLRSKLKLEKFRLWGVVRGFHTPYDGWKLQPTFNLDDEVWSPQMKAYVMQNTSKLADVWKRCHDLSSADISRRLDLFMTPSLSWPWPLHASHALERRICSPQFRGHHTDQCQQDCVHSIAEINQAWIEGIQRSPRGWKDGSAPETQGIGEAKIRQTTTRKVSTMEASMKMVSMRTGCTSWTSTKIGRELRTPSARMLVSASCARASSPKFLDTRNDRPELAATTGLGLLWRTKMDSVVV